MIWWNCVSISNDAFQRISSPCSVSTVASVIWKKEVYVNNYNVTTSCTVSRNIYQHLPGGLKLGNWAKSSGLFPPYCFVTRFSSSSRAFCRSGYSFTKFLSLSIKIFHVSRLQNTYFLERQRMSDDEWISLNIQFAIALLKRYGLNTNTSELEEFQRHNWFIQPLMRL